MSSENHPYTCVGCSLAFASTDGQRAHYSSDLHRYNAKRRIAGLTPVSAEIYNQKIVERRQQIAQEEKASADRIACEACRKYFSSSNAYQDHLNSRKHKEQQVKAIARSFAPANVSLTTAHADQAASLPDQVAPNGDYEQQDENRDDDESMAVDESDADALQNLLAKKAQFATQIPHLQCLFCTRTCQSWSGKMKHMHAQHGFFVPDREYLVDEVGLVRHLAEIIAVWNICITCGLGFGQIPSDVGEQDKEKKLSDDQRQKQARKGLDAVRKHMCAKNHCKILWDTEEQRLEVSDFYDFSSSWANSNGIGSEAQGESAGNANGDAEWEDVDEEDDVSEGDVDVIIDETQTSDHLHQETPKFGDTPFELVLPSGKRIGHRALRSFYKQNLLPAFHRQDENEQRRLQLLADAQSPAHEQRTADNSESTALVVPQRNGQMMLARNAGEAKWATKQTFAESKARSLFETKRGFVGNNQKHFRDPLLQ